MSPHKTVFGIPELLTLILSHLDICSLCAAIRVDRSWLQCGICTLWRKPALTGVIEAARSERWDCYAAQARTLEVKSADLALLYRLPPDRTLPGLRHLTLRGGDETAPVLPLEGVPWARYFGPALLSFSSPGVEIRDEALDVLHAKSPQLRELQAYLAPSSGPALADKFPRLSDLTLTVELLGNGQWPVVQSLATLPGLRKLHLTMFGPDDEFAPELLALKALTQLDTLTIKEKYQLAPADFDDADFFSVFAKLGKLRLLEFGVRSYITGRAMYSLATSCPLLEKCTMRGCYNLREIDSEMKGVVFPVLRFLKLGRLEPPRDREFQTDDESLGWRWMETRTQTKRLLASMPKLETLDFSGYDPFTHYVAELVKKSTFPRVNTCSQSMA